MSGVRSPPPKDPPRHLPPGWQCEFEPERRLPYYINLKTGLSQWTPPTSPAHSRAPTPEPSQLPQDPTAAPAPADIQTSPSNSLTPGTNQHKPTTAGKINNIITGIEQGFKSGLRGQRYGVQGNTYDDGGFYGYTGSRRARGGLISGIIGAVMGAVGAQKYPVQDIKAGGRPGGVGVAGVVQGQEMGVRQGTSQVDGGREFEPPSYEPGQHP